MPNWKVSVSSSSHFVFLQPFKKLELRIFPQNWSPVRLHRWTGHFHCVPTKNSHNKNVLQAVSLLPVRRTRFVWLKMKWSFNMKALISKMVSSRVTKVRPESRVTVTTRALNWTNRSKDGSVCPIKGVEGGHVRYQYRKNKPSMTKVSK